MNSFTVRLRRKALADVGRIRNWYQKIDPVLEDRFVRSLNEGLDRIEAHPFGYQVVYRNTRRISLDKFPYSVYYLVQDERVIVLAVIHHKHNPELARCVAE
ncbi:MAG: type II toxin-antitoxin system RelE/ParE family toxin [Terracidiphilus sp.]